MVAPAWTKGCLCFEGGGMAATEDCPWRCWTRSDMRAPIAQMPARGQRRETMEQRTTAVDERVRDRPRPDEPEDAAVAGGWAL